jgi:hypothetical protein
VLELEEKEDSREGNANTCNVQADV